MLTDSRNIGLYIFAVIVLAISWSTVKAIQQNYELQKKVSGLNQQNDVLRLQNETIDLQNKFYQTDYYLDLAARQNLGLAAPGEKVLLVSKQVALSHVNQKMIADTVATTQPDKRSKYVKNIADWRDFLLGRKLFSD